MQGPYVTNTYGGGISCQGPTANITPFITHSRSYQDPFERFYYEPQYDGRDVKGQKIEIQQQVKNYPWEEWYDDRVRTIPMILYMMLMKMVNQIDGLRMVQI